MKKFTQTGLWAMLRNPKSAKKDSAANVVLNEFVDELQAYCREEKNIPERARSLWFAKNELSPHLKRLQTGPKKKCAVAGRTRTGDWLHRLRTEPRGDGSGIPAAVS